MRLRGLRRAVVHRRARAIIAVAGTALVGVSFVGASPASAADASITSSGPLTNITISDELNCAVNHTGDASGEFYGDTACATEVALGGVTYGPSNIPAGNDPGGFVPVSQSGVTGSGTAGDPYRIVTVVDVGTTGLRITETDTYVVGQESYRTDVQVTNTTGSAVNAVLYRGGDCYLQDSDDGFGMTGSPAGAVACVAPDANDPSVPGTRIEQWIPLTSGSHYYEASYSQVWSAMDAGTQFPDTCRCSELIDNGAGLSWPVSLAAGGSATYSHLTTFSPAGTLALTMTKTADSATATAGSQDGYTITISNPNASAATLDTVVDELPAGFSYVAGSTTGATTSNPAVAGQQLTWSGPISVPGGTPAVPGTTSLHFSVTVSTTPGTYYNAANATSSGNTVVPTGNTAPITISTAGTTTTTTAPTTTTTAPTTTTTTAPTTTTTAPTTTTTTAPTTTTTAPTTTTTTAPPTCGIRPGWGYGDTNHCHTGPPGRLISSTRPVGPRPMVFLLGVGLIVVAVFGDVRPRRRHRS
jgi:hypothetical protein